MNKPIKILHINSNWEVIYFIIRDGAFIKSGVPLKTTLEMLKNSEEFDLILSEPQNIAILAAQTKIEKAVSDPYGNFCRHS